MATIKTLFDGRLALFHREDSPNIYYRIKHPTASGWLPARSTGTTDRREAQTIAEDDYLDVRHYAKHNVAVVSTAFNLMADAYLKDLQELIDRGKKKARNTVDYRPVIERYLKPFFGDTAIDQIGHKKITAYAKWRRDYWISGPGADIEFIEYERDGKIIKSPITKREFPIIDTIKRENTALRRVFSFAVDDDVAQFDADAKGDAPLLGHLGVALGHAPLRLDRAFGGVDDRGEFQQQTIAHGLDDAPTMLSDQPIDQFRPMRPESGQGAGLVHAHEARIADHVGRDDCR